MKLIAIEEHIGEEELAEASASSERLEEMDANGIDMQVLSYASQPESSAAARRINDGLARLCQRKPDRFAAFATLDWSDAGGAGAELGRAVGKLGLKGVLLAGRPSQGDARVCRILKKYGV